MLWMCATGRFKDNIYFTCGRLSKVLLFPIQDGESWSPDTCSRATCDKGKVIAEHVPCSPVTMPVCENGKPPVRVYDKGGCCFQYDCQCKFKWNPFKMPHSNNILKLLHILYKQNTVYTVFLWCNTESNICRFMWWLGRSSLRDIWWPVLQLSEKLHICTGQRDHSSIQF